MYVGVAAALLVAARLPKLHSTFKDSSEARAVLLAGGLVLMVYPYFATSVVALVSIGVVLGGAIWYAAKFDS